MSEEQRRILDMLAAGKISVTDAEQLLNAVQGNAREVNEPLRPGSGRKPKYLMVNVFSQDDKEGQPGKVNVRVPLQMLRAGVKLAAIMPAVAKTKVNEALSEKGIQIDLDNLKPEDLQELIDAMAEMTVDVNEGKDKVRVWCE